MPSNSSKILRKLTTLSAAAVWLALSAGCATPASRIKDSPQVFAQATPEQQTLIKQGQVGLDFTPAFVKLAMGEPDRITERIDAKGKETIWHYTSSDPVPAYWSPYGPFGWYGPYGPYGGWPPVSYVNSVPSDPDRLRVVFHDGKVTMIERVIDNN